MVDIDLSCKISTATGWVDLESGPYSLHSDSWTARASTHRKTEVSGGRWVAGTFTVDVVSDNFTDTLAVWVDADTPFEYRAARDVLTDALDQISYKIQVRFGDMKETLSCQVADWTVDEQAAFRYATFGLVRASVPILPSITVEMVSP